jgi:hypothetical protein
VEQETEIYVIKWMRCYLVRECFYWLGTNSHGLRHQSQSWCPLHQDAIPLRNTIIELGHPQPPTPIQTDNSTAAGFANNTIKQAMDMRFYWIKDQVEQGQFLICWCPESENLGNYFTKHHLPSHNSLSHSSCLFEPQAYPKAQLRQCSARVCQFCLRLRLQQWLRLDSSD